MSRENLPFLTGLLVIPIWTFVALPVSYGSLPMATVIQTLISLLAPAAAFFALLVAHEQLSLNRKNQRETTAVANFREFLKLCVEYPDLARGNPSEQNKGRYEWFVAVFLWAAEEILEYAPGEWEANLRLHVLYHRNYLQNDPDFRQNDWPAYTRALQGLIDRTISLSPPPQQQEQRQA